MYTNCTNLNIGGLVFQNLLHNLSFDGLIGYNTALDVSTYSLSISSILQGDFMKLGTFLTLMPHGDDYNFDMAIHFLPMTKGYFGQMYNVQVSILDSVFTTSVYFQGDTLHFSADTVIFQTYSTLLAVTANLYSQWNDLLLHINGTLSNEPQSFYEKVEARVHNIIQNIASRATYRLSEAENFVATQSQQLNELTVEYTYQMSALNASQDAFRRAYENLQTANDTAKILKHYLAMVSNTTKQLEDGLSSICAEETCSDICIPGVILGLCYQTVAVSIPYTCSSTKIISKQETRIIHEKQWIKAPQFYLSCKWKWFFFLASYQCSTNCRTVDVLIETEISLTYLSFEPVLEMSICFDHRTQQLSYRCNTIVSCSQRAPDLECIARNAACRAAKKLAVDNLEQSRQSAAAVLLTYSEARQNLSIAQTNEAIARQHLSKAQKSFNAILTAYNNVLQANTSAQANYESIVNEIANDLSLARALDENKPDTLFKLSSITFNISMERESPTELLLNFTYQKFQQYYSTLIAVDFTVEQERNQDIVAQSLVEHAYNTHARKRSVQLSKRQLAAQSNEDSYKAKCNDLVNINTFLTQLASSLQTVTGASHSNIEAPINMTQSAFNAEKSINFSALSISFNTTIAPSDLLDIVKKDKGLSLMNIAISELHAVAMQRSNISDKAVFYDWQSQIGFLLNKTNSIGGNPCFGFKDCLVTVSDIIQQLLESLSISWINASTLFNNYAAVKKNLIAVANNIITTAGDAEYIINEIIGIINNTELNAYWCSEKPNITDIPFGNQSVVLEGTLNLTCMASSAGNIKYQWRRNGNIIAGSTYASLNIYNMQLSDEGSYTCYASNAGGTSQSIPINVTVSYPPALYLMPDPISVFTGDFNGAIFSCNATARPAAGWRWYFKAHSTDTWKPLIRPM